MLAVQTFDDVDAIDARLATLFPTRRLNRVLLVNPPDAHAKLFRWDTAKRGRYTNYPPYGLGIIAANLRKVDCDVRILNLNHAVLEAARSCDTEDEFNFNETWQELLNDTICEFQPHMIGIGCMFTMTHTSFRQVCTYAGGRGIPIIAGGVHVTNDVDRILDDIPDIDIAVLREGDVTIRRLVECVRNRDHQLSRNLRGIIFSGAPVRQLLDGESTPEAEDLNTIPTYDQIPLASLSAAGTVGAFYCFKPPGTVFATALSNRGCRAQCTFCSVRNFNGKRVRQRSVESVLDELQLLTEVHGVRHVMWLDDDLLKDEARAIRLFNGIVQRKLNMTWDATNGLIAASCTPEVCSAMAESGCIAVNIGMESGSPTILRQVKKPGVVHNFIEAAHNLSRHEQIHTSVFLMIGFPGETMGMIRETVAVAQEMGMDWNRISPLQPLPGTPIYESMVAQGLVAPLGSSELRFMGGAYGKQAEIESGQRSAELRLTELPPELIPDPTIPSPDQITQIWGWMNYTLNFRRLGSEQREIKIQQQLAHLGTLADVISPENGFALYYMVLLRKRLSGAADPEILDRLQRRLEQSAYWRSQFAMFGLDPTSL